MGSGCRTSGGVELPMNFQSVQCSMHMNEPQVPVPKLHPGPLRNFCSMKQVDSIKEDLL